MKKLLAAFCFAIGLVAADPSRAALCDSFKTIIAPNDAPGSPPFNYTLSASDFGECLSIDAAQNEVTITVPNAATLGAGSVNVKKIDLTSNIIRF